MQLNTSVSHHPGDSSPATLADRCLAGDQTAISQLIDRFRDRVFGICYRLLGQRQDAEDAAQETFVRAIRYLAKWDQHRDFEPWLFAIAGNRCRTLIAKRARGPQMQCLDQASQLRDVRTHQANLLEEEVSLALVHLSEKHRQAFLLFHEQELCYEEISRTLNCPVGTVKTWVYRARKELIQRLIDRGAVETNAEASSHAVR